MAIQKSLHQKLLDNGFEFKDIHPMANWRTIALDLDRSGYLNDKEQFLIVSGSCVPEAKGLVDEGYKNDFESCCLTYVRSVDTSGSTKIDLRDL